jgi:hypothetical protein
LNQPQRAQRKKSFQRKGARAQSRKGRTKASAAYSQVCRFGDKIMDKISREKAQKAQNKTTFAPSGGYLICRQSGDPSSKCRIFALLRLGVEFCRFKV